MKRRLSPVDFAAVVPLVSMTPERLEAARLFLVDGASQRKIATVYGVTPQSVSDAVGIVYRTWLKQQEGLSAGHKLPEGWVVSTLAAPAELMAKFRQEITEVRRLEEG